MKDDHFVEIMPALVRWRRLWPLFLVAVGFGLAIGLAWPR